MWLLCERRHCQRALARAWSVSHPVCASPVFASTLPSMPNADATCDGRRPGQLLVLSMHSRRGRVALPWHQQTSKIRTGERTGCAGGRRPIGRQILRATHAVSTRDAHRHSAHPRQAGCLDRRFKDARHCAPWARPESGMLCRPKWLPRSGAAARLQLMIARVPGQRRVVALDVELEVVLQAVRAQEGHRGRHIPVVLVLGRLLSAHAAGSGTLHAPRSLNLPASTTLRLTAAAGLHALV
jgi:hypothetical protein